MSSAKWRPFCLGVNVLSRHSITIPYDALGQAPYSWYSIAVSQQAHGCLRQCPVTTDIKCEMLHTDWGYTCYVDLTGGGAAPKGHFLSQGSLAKGVFLTKIP